jgi:hypothetical protein
MDKKQKSNYREIKKKMKKLTIAEKKQIKEKEKKENKERKEKQQKITQRVKVNINIPRSVSQSSGFSNFPFPNSNTEQTTLLKLLNEQLKTNNKPISSNKMFNIPEVKKDEPKVVDIFNDVIERNPLFNTNKKQLPFDLKRGLMEKVKEREERIDKGNIIPIVNKPIDNSNMDIFQQIQARADERKLKNIDTEDMEKKLAEENKKDFSFTSPLKDELFEKVKEKKERESMSKEDNIPVVNAPKDISNLGMFELIREKTKIPVEQEEGYGLKPSGDEPVEQKKKVGRKPNTEEYKEQKRIEKEQNRLKNNKQINEEAFARLLTKVDEPTEYKTLTEMFNSGQLQTKALKSQLVNYGFSKEKIEGMYKNYR